MKVLMMKIKNRNRSIMRILFVAEVMKDNMAPPPLFEDCTFSIANNRVLK